MNFLSLLALLSSAGGCHPVAGDRILSDDLARVLPVFAGLPPGLPIGYSPAPGVRRVLHEDELLRIAKFNGIQATHIPPVCFAMPMRAAEESAVVKAMETSLVNSTAKVRLVDVQPRLVPQGKIVFPRATLVPPPNSPQERPVLWRGYVEFAAGRRYPVTAKTFISETSTRVVAAVELLPGTAIGPEALRLETIDRFPTTGEQIQSIEQVAGKVPRRVIAAGQPICVNDIRELPSIQKGERVRVEVRNGPAHLSLEGEAESAGYRGQTIPIRNLSTGKRFPAKVESAGLVLVLPKGGAR